MRCTFCSSPAAHPGTARQYGAKTLACHACVDSFWTWLEVHFRAHAHGGPEHASTFYEAASRFGRRATMP